MSQDEQNCQACGIGRICRLVKGHGGPHEWIWIASNPKSEYQRGYEAGLEAAAKYMDIAVTREGVESFYGKQIRALPMKG